MRIVVKVGTSTLAHSTGRLNIQRMERFCKVLSDLKNMGHEIILVTATIAESVSLSPMPNSAACRPSRLPPQSASAS